MSGILSILGTHPENLNSNQDSFECRSLSEDDHMHPFLATIYCFMMSISSIITRQDTKCKSSQNRFH